MKTFAKIASVFCLGSVLCLADTFSGKVVDASCRDQSSQNSPSAQSPSSQSTSPSSQPASACEPTSATTGYAIQTSDGKVLRLDSTGNSKVADAMKSSSNKAAMVITVTGTLDGQVIKVDTIDLK